jgi:hypothetical protein
MRTSQATKGNELNSESPFLRDAIRRGEGECANTVAFSHCLSTTLQNPFTSPHL